MLVVLIADGRRRNGEWYYLYISLEKKKKRERNFPGMDSTFILCPFFFLYVLMVF